MPYSRAMIRFDNIGKQHGKQILFLEASAVVNRGEKVGLVGPNGSGKSTLFRLILKEESPDEGQVCVDRGVTIGYFSQDVGELGGQSVVEETMDGAGPVSKIARELRVLEQALADSQQQADLDQLLDRFGEAQARFGELGGYGLEANAREILAGLGFAQDTMDDDVGTLSGGWKMRVALARILLMRPDALLLDEPTNHLDIESIIWLESYLRGFAGAILLTSHDREFMNRMVHKIIEIDSGELCSYAGNYDFYERQSALGDREAEARFARQQAMLRKEFKFIERFKARASHASQVQSRVKKIDKIEKVEPPKSREVIEFDFRTPPRSGEDVLSIQGLHKAYAHKVIYAGFDFLVRRQERWCVMGVNGAGKSTLLKLAAQATDPDRGVVNLGASVKFGYFAQHAMELLAPELTVSDTLQHAFPLASIGQLRSVAGCFGFSGDEVDKTCRILSGGEKARLVMARMLYDPPNFLILDEPTNHLDLLTKAMLIRALKKFEGTMLFVSHDRHFLAELSNRVLEITPEGIAVFGGGYTEYVQRTGHEAPGLRS